MQKAEVLSLCNEYGEFYIHYEYLRPPKPGTTRRRKTTYLQGTLEFDDKYLAPRFSEENLKEADDEHILVFSRTGDCFRYIPVSKIKKITSLSAELKI